MPPKNKGRGREGKCKRGGGKRGDRGGREQKQKGRKAERQAKREERRNKRRERKESRDKEKGGKKKGGKWKAKKEKMEKMKKSKDNLHKFAEDPEATEETANFMWQKYDVDESGTLTLGEVSKMVAELCENSEVAAPPADVIAGWFGDFDENKSDVLEEEEFADFLAFVSGEIEEDVDSAMENLSSEDTGDDEDN